MLFIGNVMRPTYIYIKQHLKTGLKYLGKTVKDPYKYLGFYQDMASKFGVNRRIIRKAYLGITWPNLND